jgi:hypothetical protein
VGARRVVILAPTLQTRTTALPPSAVLEDKVTISGGERSLYELAAAASCAGYETELRGDLCKPLLDQIATAAGATISTPPTPREIESNDVVIFPEVLPTQQLMNLFFSEARLVLFQLSAPGSISWDGSLDWELVDLFTVPFEQLGRPEGFRAFDALGCDIWTHASGIAQRGRAAGIPVQALGEGCPVLIPEPQERHFDVALVEENRWSDWAEEVVAMIPKASVYRIPLRTLTYALWDDLQLAKILILPARVEGLSRIAREARSVGTVPIMLDENPFLTDADYGEGVIRAESLTAMAFEAERLLADAQRWSELSQAAMISAAEQSNWGAYVDRVDQAIASVEPHAIDPFRRAFTEVLRDGRT